jgi:hypothetical protein
MGFKKLSSIKKNKAKELFKANGEIASKSFPANSALKKIIKDQPTSGGLKDVLGDIDHRTKIDLGDIAVTAGEVPIRNRIYNVQVKNLEKLKPMDHIPALLLRTLNDYFIEGTPKERLSAFQSRIIDIWNKNKLTQDDANSIMSNFYISNLTGESVASKLEQKILQVPLKDLDKTFNGLNNEERISKYFENSTVSPVRIKQALETKDYSSLTKIEKEYVERYDEQKLKLIFSPGKTNYKESDTRQRDEDEYYMFSSNYYSYQLDQTADGIKGTVEPVFLTFSFYKDTFRDELVSTYASVKPVKPVLEKIEAAPVPYYVESKDEIILSSNDRDEVFFLLGALRLNKGDIPIIVGGAIEDDTYFADSTKKYINLAFEIVSYFAIGTFATVLSIAKFVWDLLCLIDALDKDDLFYNETFTLDETIIPTDGHYNYYLIEEHGDNRWHLKISYCASDDDPYKFEPEALKIIKSIGEYGGKDVEIWQIGYDKEVIIEARNPLTGEKIQIPTRKFISVIGDFKDQMSAEELMNMIKKKNLSLLHSITEDFQQRYIWFVSNGRSPRIYLDHIQYSREFGINDLVIPEEELSINKSIMRYSILHKDSLIKLNKDGSGLSPIPTWKVMETHKNKNPKYNQSIFDWWGEPYLGRHWKTISDSHKRKCEIALEKAIKYKWLMVQRLNTYNTKFLVV